MIGIVDLVVAGVNIHRAVPVDGRLRMFFHRPSNRTAIGHATFEGTTSVDDVLE
jgi:hypothetical protein